MSGTPVRRPARAAAPSPRAAIAAHRDDEPGPLFGIAELCREFGLTPRALRFYEDQGCSRRGGSTARACTPGATARGSR